MIKNCIVGQSLIVLWTMVWIAACSSLPSDFPRQASYAVSPDPNAEIAQSLHFDADGPKDHAQFLLLNDGAAALRCRLALADMARRSIDMQYFIWHGDESGILLLDRVLKAADRGARVRLLLDDFHVKGADIKVAALDRHPNVEIRIFNPFSSRSTASLPRFFELATSMDRLNHRMHNKVFVADNHAAIIGGRNIGNEYFGLSEDVNFRDMDLLSIGPIAGKISDSFDAYWNSRWAYPIEALSPSKIDEEDMTALRDEIRKRMAERREIMQSIGTEPKDWRREINGLRDRLVEGKVQVIYDQPPSGDGAPADQMFRQLIRHFEEVKEEMLVISPYFIPRRKGVELFDTLASKGVKITILTNSLASNDVVFYHSAYKRYRRGLLDAGIDLFELRADAEDRSSYSTAPVLSRWLGLHAKAAVFDKQKVYIGSLNLDPRSARLNTEIGLIIESPALADQVMKAFGRDLKPANSWRVELDERKRMVWKSDETILYRQPARSFSQRTVDFLFWAAPVESQL
jgi:putative cardiolipin synthase